MHLADAAASASLLKKLAAVLHLHELEEKLAALRG